jgi:hypothetical protein
MNLEELKARINKYKDISLEEIDPNNVDDITSINIDKRKSSNERLLDFLMKVKNPYVFKVKGKLVKISFSEDSNKTADDCLTNVLKNLY